jgi:DNA polymerase-3 subunit gamma/tau
VGKTTTARILAKALNCSHGPTNNPCDRCDSCESIASGDDVDVIEIDGASNRGIDEVRELRQNVNLRPTRGRYKIYIIDEVHMLTREAFNALLKTLEEPPEHVKFIFATTDPQKIPVTILSRCQRFDFGTIANDRIRQKLEEIVRREGIVVDGPVLELVTRRAAGSMRDALSLMDQLLAFSGERVSTDQVHRLLGTASEDRLLQLSGSLIERNAGSAIDVLDDAESHGVQLGELVDQLIEYFRDLMVLKCAGVSARLKSVTSAARDRAAEQAERLPFDFIFAVTDILSEVKSRLRGTNYGRILLDIALVRIATLEDLSSFEDLASRLASIESRVGGSQPAGRAGAGATSPREPAAADPKKKAEQPSNHGDRPVTPIAPVLSSTAPRVPQPIASSNVPESNEPHVLPVGPHHTAVVVPSPFTAEAAGELVRELSENFGVVLRESIVRAKVSVDPSSNTLVLGLDPMYQGRMKEIESALQGRVGTALRIRVELCSAIPTVAQAAGTRRSNYSERLSEATRDPLVQHAIDVFGARVIRVDEN